MKKISIFAIFIGLLTSAISTTNVAAEPRTVEQIVKALEDAKSGKEANAQEIVALITEDDTEENVSAAFVKLFDQFIKNPQDENVFNKLKGLALCADLSSNSLHEKKSYLLFLASEIYPNCCYHALVKLCNDIKNLPKNPLLEQQKELETSRTKLCSKLYSLQKHPSKDIYNRSTLSRNQNLHFLDDATRLLIINAEENGAEATREVLRVLNAINSSALAIQLVYGPEKFEPFCNKKLTEKECDFILESRRGIATGLRYGNLTGYEFSTAVFGSEKSLLCFIQDPKIIDIVVKNTQKLGEDTLIGKLVAYGSNIFRDLVETENPTLLNKVFEHCASKKDLISRNSENVQRAYAEAFNKDKIELLKIFLKYKIPVTSEMYDLYQKKAKSGQNTAFLNDEKVKQIIGQLEELERQRLEQEQRIQQAEAERKAKEGAEAKALAEKQAAADKAKAAANQAEQNRLTRERENEALENAQIAQQEQARLQLEAADKKLLAQEAEARRILKKTKEEAQKKLDAKRHKLFIGTAIVGGLSIAAIAAKIIYNKVRLNKKIKEAVTHIEKLQDAFDDDKITEAQFNKQKQEIINSLGLQKYTAEIEKQLEENATDEDEGLTEGTL